MTASGAAAVDDLPVLMGGERPGTEWGTRATLARDGRTRARARRRHCILGRVYVCVAERPVTRPAIGRRFEAPPYGTRRARPIAVRVTGHTGGMII